MSLFSSLFGANEKNVMAEYRRDVEAINALEPRFADLSPEALRAEADRLRAAVRAGATLASVTHEAFALVREAAKRALNQRHYDVQLVGGMVLAGGNIAEMRTGEGKTLMSILPLFLNSLEGKGVHLVTVNDYLARRDAVWMGQVFALLGTSVGVLNQSQSFLYDPSHVEKDAERDDVAEYKIVYEFLKPISRKEAYRTDITYGTNSEYAFDYLRDNLEYRVSDLRHRGFHFAIVDEIDSILIDEARTPLIISGPAADSGQLYVQFAKIADQLQEGTHYNVDEKHHQVVLTDEGIHYAEKQLGIENVYAEGDVKYAFHLETAVRAKALHKREKDYVVRDGEVIIVDEYTGRLQPGRRWSSGIHQAVEAKEGVEIRQETRTLGSITYQNYFRLYKRLGGMTGTAMTSREEFYKVYGLDVKPIPTHRPVVRNDKRDAVFTSEHGKFTAIGKRVAELHKKGQPVLIGTASIEKNEQLSDYLKAARVPHQVLNAKNHEREGEIVANAGLKGAVTVATNMAGRGVDIKLGGIHATKEQADEVRSLGGLCVIGTERHTARRIDNQLRGRSGRQGDPGETQFYVSLDDQLMRMFKQDFAKTLLTRVGTPEDQAIESRILSRLIESSQTKIEGILFDSRKNTLEYDDVLNFQRTIIYSRRSAILNADHESLPQAFRDFFETMGDAGAGERAEELIESKAKEIGRAEALDAVRMIALRAIDTFWIDHLDDMDYLRNSVVLRAYGQREPLVEYKREGLRLFRTMQRAVYDHVIDLLPRVVVAKQEAGDSLLRNAVISGGGSESETVPTAAAAPIASGDQPLGRNDKVMMEKNGERKEVKTKHVAAREQEGWKLVQ